MTTPELRKIYQDHYIEYMKIHEEWERQGYGHPHPQFPSFPEECIGMICGAKTRKGTPCKQRGLYMNGRCKLHGGLSTGPRTKRGKRRSALNGFKASNEAMSC